MSTRAETRLWMAQRASAAVLAIAVLVHLATIVYAVRGGLTGAEIVERVGSSVGWLVFYLVFVLAVSVHAPLGIRTVLGELTSLSRMSRDVIAGAFAALTLVLGVVAATGLFLG